MQSDSFCGILLQLVKSQVLEKGGPLPCIIPGMNVYIGKDWIMDLVKILSEQYMKPELPEMNVGDTVRVLVRVKEGNRERNQAFEGTIIAKKHGGINETITVRRISYGCRLRKGLPGAFPVHRLCHHRPQG